MPEAPTEKQLKLRYAGVCRLCQAELPARAEAIYERSTKTVRCFDCPSTSTPDQPVRLPVPIVLDVPGASARREYERRQTKRGAGIRERHPRLAGLILAVTDDPQSTTAWRTGAIGEEQLGQRLNALVSPALRVLHDRRIPAGRANIDHVAITPSGVYVIDAKRYRGVRPRLEIEGGILRPRVEKLVVGSRDQTKVVDGVLKQVDVVRRLVCDGVPVTGVLCFIESDWPLIGGSFTTRGVDVLWPKKLLARLTSAGPHTSDVDRLHRQIAAELAPA